MAAKRLSYSILAATLVGALGWWVSAGAVALESGSRAGARLGLLPPLWWLAAAISAAVALSVFGSRRLGFGAVAFGGLTLLPWLPVRVPAAFLVWAGPVATWLWILAAAAVVGRSIAAVVPASLRHLAADPRRAPLAAAAIAAVLY